MTSAFTLFEVSWEVCNKVGGIHTVLSTKARLLADCFAGEYVAVGPWMLADTSRASAFDEEDAHKEFRDACRAEGLPVRVGRWKIPGRPRTILVEFSHLYDQKDAILAGLWEDYGVDSISGGWDYVEPVLFGYAAALVIEQWWEVYLAPVHRRGVVQAHEWMTGSALLSIKKRVPSMGTIFTTHATMLGRALSSLGHSPDDGLADRTSAQLAEEHQVAAKHSMEGTSARQADVFTTVSEITAREAELLHGRAPMPLLPNGIDLSVIDELAGESTRGDVRATLTTMASAFLGEDVSAAAFLCVSGRYEFHNKGIDLLLDALAELAKTPGRPIVMWILVPAGNSGPKSEVLARRTRSLAEINGAVGIATHNLFDEGHDAIHAHCEKLGLTNQLGSRVKVIHVPIYLARDDGFWNLPYEAVLRAMDVSCFPSYYEPWGYTPQESLVVGVPTITTDYAGFGRWATSLDLGPADGITVLPRVHLEYEAIVEDLHRELERHASDGADRETLAAACRRTAARTSWDEFLVHYQEAWKLALEAVHGRLVSGVPQTRRPKLALTVQLAPDGRRPRLVSFDVAASLPSELAGLERLSRNYWWSWDAEARSLFEELSPLTWEATGHNPTLLLHRAWPEDLEARAADVKYRARLARVLERFDAYLAAAPRVPRVTNGPSVERPIAYFSAEFGIHESLRIYSGGLGILAGDHLKSASDLGLPLVAVGLYYRMGYFTQRLSPAGEQVSSDVENDPKSLPMELLRDERGEPIEITLQLPGRELALRAWRVRVGRVDLHLLDTNVEKNRPEDREITRNLYGGDQERRLQQEIVLGRGGVRLLARLSIEPSVWHVNEGHAAFQTIERVGSLLRKEGLTFEEARELVRATTVFTTHTPVPAGHDRFGEDLMRRYFSDAPDWVGLPWERFWALGHSAESRDTFNVTYLALAFASFVNGVSVLHGVASRSLLHPVWPALLESEVPVQTITNGIHLASWTHPEIQKLLGATGRGVQGEDFARGAPLLEGASLWKIKREAKRGLLDRVRAVLQKSFVARHDSPLLLARIQDGLDEEALWIGFARRFAPYKRAHLMFKDPARLRAILQSEDRPVRVLVAGKAHPRDEHGQRILREIVELTRRDEYAGRVIFVEEYDIDLSRALVQGVDVWLNTPTRMLEASGTSGMKAAANASLNLSIADGWWAEGARGKNGWTIAGPRVYEDPELQDQLDSGTLYRMLEEEIVPLYFQRHTSGVPLEWIERMRESLATIPPRFNTDRMVREYHDKAYARLALASAELLREEHAALKQSAAERTRVRKAFGEIAIVSARIADLAELRVGDPIDVHVEVKLGTLRASDVVVEFVFGHARERRDLSNATHLALRATSAPDSPIQSFEGSHPMERSGGFAYGIRVRPSLAVEDGDSLQDLVLWA